MSILPQLKRTNRQVGGCTWEKQQATGLSPIPVRRCAGQSWSLLLGKPLRWKLLAASSQQSDTWKLVSGSSDRLLLSKAWPGVRTLTVWLPRLAGGKSVSKSEATESSPDILTVAWPHEPTDQGRPQQWLRNTPRDSICVNIKYILDLLKQTLALITPTCVFHFCWPLSESCVCVVGVSLSLINGSLTIPEGAWVCAIRQLCGANG